MSESKAIERVFCEQYPESGEPLVCRAPGRVNIIGEHTDYNGLPVLPMTIDRDIRIAFAPRQDALVRMRDVDVAFPLAEFANATQIQPSPGGSWENYCKAAVSGLNAHFHVKKFRGMDMLVGGSIPMSAGLSSSSALVVACALAYLRVLGKTLGADISRLELAALMAESEQYVGTRGGGMDQAIILLGQDSAACKIDFFPLRVEQAPLPRDYAFVICNSLVKAEKSGQALHRYNAGPRLCRLICAMVAKRLKAEFGPEIEIERLGDLWHGHLCLTDGEAANLFAKTFRTDTVTLAEASAELRLSPEEIRQRWLGDLHEPEQGFALKKRAHHQLTEYQRVESTRDALQAGDVEHVGRLMDASHESCATNYDISCPELDALVTIARESGALGARLTGAGFGGCTVNLVPIARLETFRASVAERYYEEYLGQRGIAPRSVDDAIFAARASAPAGYL